MHRQIIVWGDVPVCPKPALALIPAIKVRRRGMELMASIEVLSVDSIAEIFADFSPITIRAKSSFLRSASCNRQIALRIFRLFGDDIDDAIDGVRSPNAYRPDPESLRSDRYLRA